MTYAITRIMRIAALTLAILIAPLTPAQPDDSKTSVEISEDGTPVAPVQPTQNAPVSPTETTPTEPTSPNLVLAPARTAQATTGTIRMLKTLEAFHENVKSVHVTFDQLRTDMTFEDKIESHGELWFVKPDRFRCDYADPQPMINLIVGLSFWTYMPELEQADLFTFDTPAQRDQQLHQILIAFGFQTDQLLKEYEIHSSVDETQPLDLLKEEKISPEKTVLFTVKPRPDYVETSPFLELRIFVDRTKLQPVKIWYSDQNDSTMLLTMKKIELDAKIDDKVFDVKALIPPGTDIIDKRNMQ